MGNRPQQPNVRIKEGHSEGHVPDRDPSATHVPVRDRPSHEKGDARRAGGPGKAAKPGPAKEP